MAVISKELFSYNNLVHAVSGAVGSMIGMLVFYPLDTVRCRLQLEENRKAKNTLEVMKELVEKEGVSTLYRGIVPVLQSICASNFVYFYVYHGLKHKFAGRNNLELLMATVAGAVNVLVTSPLWVVNTRMKMSGITNTVDYDSLIDGLITISRNEGCMALWSGTLPSLVLVSNPAIHMAVYEYLKRIVQKNSALSYFILSALAKITATMATYPIQLAQTRQRHGHHLRDIKNSVGMVQVLLYIFRKEGPTGLYKGIEAKLLQTVLTSAFMFMCYEEIAAFVFRIMRKPKI